MDDAESCYNLGVSYHDGQGVKQDYKKAVELFFKACEADYVKGCYNLGGSYYNGQGVKQDRNKASELYAKACDMGLKQGCDNHKILSK